MPTSFAEFEDFREEIASFYTSVLNIGVYLYTWNWIFLLKILQLILYEYRAWIQLQLALEWYVCFLWIWVKQNWMNYLKGRLTWLVNSLKESFKQAVKMSVVSGSRMRETIHSGHFMVSDFEPESEAQDEEYEVGMPLPPGPDDTVVVKGNAGRGMQQSNAGASANPSTSPYGAPEPIIPTPSNVQQELFMDLPNFGRNFLTQNFGETFMAQQPQFQQPPPQQQQQQPQQDALMTFQQRQLQLQQRNSWISIDSSLTKLFQCMSLAYR